MVNYYKSKIYAMKRRSNDEILFTGGTISDLKRRYWNHKCNPNDLLYKKIRNMNINWNDVKIELIKEHPFFTRNELKFASRLGHDEDLLDFYLDNI
jgi:hypothetical protein